jgi:hypothetical protein
MIRTMMPSTNPARVHVYEVRPRKDKRGVDLISDALPFDRLWYREPISPILKRCLVTLVATPS